MNLTWRSENNYWFPSWWFHLQQWWNAPESYYISWTKPRRSFPFFRHYHHQTSPIWWYLAHLLAELRQASKLLRMGQVTEWVCISFVLLLLLLLLSSKSFAILVFDVVCLLLLLFLSWHFKNPWSSFSSKHLSFRIVCAGVRNVYSSLFFNESDDQWMWFHVLLILLI